MLLLNQGMMQFFKHPTHRKDLSSMNSNNTFLIGGNTPLSPAEIQELTNITSIFPFSRSAATSVLLGQGRFQMGFGTQVDNRAHGGLPNSSVFRWAQEAGSFQISAPGTLLYVWSISYGTSAAVTGRVAYLFSVGLVGSGADIELEKVDFVVGERVKLNDIVINIQNLLGEA